MQQPTAMDQTPPQLSRQQEIAPTSGTDIILQQLAQISDQGGLTPCRAVWVEGEPGRASPLPGARYQGAPGLLTGSGTRMEEMATYLGKRSAGD